MRSAISALKGSKSLLARRWQRPPAEVCHWQRLLHTHHHDGWQRQTLLLPRRCISASSAVSSPPDSFHGVTLREDDESASSPKIREAEVVESDDDKQRTRALIKEVTRAEMSAHSIMSNSKDDDVSDQKEAMVGPYERRLQQLNELQHRHQEIDQQETVTYAQSCMDMGESHYELGQMEDSQENYMNALKQLMDSSSDECPMMIAQCMHFLGAIHARCGEYDEASRWYEESLKQKNKILDDISDDVSSIHIYYHYELGKTYNGLAALEVMKGGDVQWEKAMSLFQQAERNYLHGYDQEKQSNHEERNALEANHSPTANVTKKAMQQMTPRHIESLINVRSNMGELLKQRGQFEAAVQTFRLALEMARMALENVYEKKAGTESSEIDDDITPTPIIDGPSPDEQRNTIVDLLLKVADNLFSAENFDEAAAYYEQALTSHVFFRRWSEEDNDDNSNQQRASAQKTEVLPAIATTGTVIKVELELAAATTMEATIRNNLAHALAQIGQKSLSLEHFEASLEIKRHIGGDFHMEVGHTLMGMGALCGGPFRDFPKALNCFKEAVYIYRLNFEECTRRDNNESSDDDGSMIEKGTFFFGDEDAEEIDRHVQNAMKNINLIESGLLKDRDSANKRRRR